MIGPTDVVCQKKKSYTNYSNVSYSTSARRNGLKIVRIQTQCARNQVDSWCLSHSGQHIRARRDPWIGLVWFGSESDPFGKWTPGGKGYSITSIILFQQTSAQV